MVFILINDCNVCYNYLVYYQLFLETISHMDNVLDLTSYYSV